MQQDSDLKNIRFLEATSSVRLEVIYRVRHDNAK